jgi:hypothetical protein
VPFGEYGVSGWLGKARESVAYGGSWHGEAGLPGPDLEEDSKHKLIFKFQMNLDFGKTLKKFTWRF